MNILMCTNAYTPIVGGVERSVETFTEDLRKLGHRTLVVTVAVTGANDSDSRVYRLPAIKEIAGTQFSLKLPVPAALQQRLDTFAPDIVHSHHPFMLGDTALRVARRRGLPLVFTHHTMYERYAYLFSEESKTLEHICRAIATEYANLCNRVIAPTPSIRDIIRDRGVTPTIDVIPTGIDIDLYANGDGKACRERYHIPPDAFVVGYLGRVVKVKNMDFVARAAVQCLTRCDTAWFLVAGDGESAEGVRRICAEAEVSDRLVMTGEVAGQAIADAYAAMNVFTFASTTDTQGIVLVEAFSAGLPVVALDAPGAKDTIVDGENGRLLAADADADEFGDALAALCRDPERLHTWSRAARRSTQEYDRVKCARRLVECYRSAIQELHGAEPAPMATLDVLQERVTAEWDLFMEKLAVIAEAISESKTS